LVSVSATNTLWPYLKYLAQFFGEPLRYWSSRERKGWGTVFNSLTGEPLDLAIVRLYDQDSGKLLESFVTDSQGRYYFLGEKGKEYYLTVSRNGFNFPSKYPPKPGKGLIYTGGAVQVKQNGDVNAKGAVKNGDGLISYEIPIDPQEGVTFVDDKNREPVKTKIADVAAAAALSTDEIAKEDKEILKKDRYRKVSFVFSLLGPILALIVLIIAPSWSMLGLFLLHVVLFLLFRRLAARKKAKPWGEVFEMKTEKSLSRVVVRLFEPRFGRILASKVTDIDGRYGFLVGDDKYLLVPNKAGYQSPEDRIEVIGQEGIVKRDIALKKTNEQ
jgi:hypothetical protein